MEVCFIDLVFLEIKFNTEAKGNRDEVRVSGGMGRERRRKSRGDTATAHTQDVPTQFSAPC